MYNDTDQVLEQYGMALSENNDNDDNQRKFLLNYKLGVYNKNQNYNTDAEQRYALALQFQSDATIEKIIQNKVKTLKPFEQEATEDDGDNHSITSNMTNKTQRVSTTVSNTSSFDLAEGYCELGDYEEALSHYKTHIKEQTEKLEEKSLIDTPTIDTETNTYLWEYIPHLLIQKITHLEMNEITTTSDSDKLESLIKSYIKCGELSIITDNVCEGVQNYISAFYLCTKLYDTDASLIQSVDELCEKLADLGQDYIIEHYKESSHDDGVWINLKIGAKNRANEDYLNSITNYMNARELLSVEENPIIDAAINYSILEILNTNYYANDEHKTFVYNINIDPKWSIFDRILIYRLLVALMNEFEDKDKETYFKDLLYQTQMEANGPILHGSYYDSSLLCIGHVLTQADDYSSAISYWNKIRELKEQMLSLPVIDIIHSADSTFIDIYNEVKLLNNNFLSYIISIAKSYNTIGNYNVRDGDDDMKLGDEEVTDEKIKLQHYERALTCYNTAKTNYNSASIIARKLKQSQVNETRQFTDDEVNEKIKQITEKIPKPNDDEMSSDDDESSS
ncbi:unnamed protein product [Didymodactylos carnosus]|uniref:Uncharacterized protein n=1 Tax=Didymodactylos carnosus TaxID=1234261 RepID=A0A815CNV3_9BILA|nr:unnamed protein product [Didymodactylos carnosus]CAF1286580.1 unnamed protein product [Didymodactylos carnosus]CAF3790713.1 unnamed protein product [Didymodactylos carnosus]CAF4087863.1 unnamed protein product [Didymodactylos carnosus]